MFAQAGITAGAAFAGDVATQKFCEKKSWGNVDYLKSAYNGAVAGITSIAGSIVGGIASSGHTITGESLLSAGQDKLLTSYLRRSAGQSYTNLLKQGRQLVAAGMKWINTARGISSVTGTVLTWGMGQRLSLS